MGDVPRILLLAHDFPPENSSAATRPNLFHKYLPRFGIESEVICGSPRLGNPPQPGVHRVPAPDAGRGVRLAAEAAWLVQRYALPYNERLPWVPHAAAKGMELMRGGGAKAIVSTSPPIAAHLAALWLKWKTGARWVADFQDPFHDNPFRTRKWLFYYDAAVERAIMENADAVIVNTSGVEEWWRKKYARFAHKFRTICNGFDPERRLEPRPLEQRRTPLLVHVGTIYGGRHPRLVAESLARLQANVYLQLVGPYDVRVDARCAELMDRLAREGKASYKDKMVPRDEADRIMAEADYLLLLDLNESETSVQVPAKLYDYLRVERPVLAFTSRGSPTESILERSGVEHALVYRTDAPETIDRKVAEFLRPGPRVTRANEWFWRTFDGVSQTRQLAEAIRGD